MFCGKNNTNAQFADIGQVQVYAHIATHRMIIGKVLCVLCIYIVVVVVLCDLSSDSTKYYSIDEMPYFSQISPYFSTESEIECAAR